MEERRKGGKIKKYRYITYTIPEHKFLIRLSEFEDIENKKEDNLDFLKTEINLVDYYEINNMVFRIRKYELIAYLYFKIIGLNRDEIMKLMNIQSKSKYYSFQNKIKSIFK